ncbi:hypothetical protein FJZ33_00320 [Candidatus Poribacteria bacterium]|nr:hypothetical protein [Candidatus Poribacteria bacterium]
MSNSRIEEKRFNISDKVWQRFYELIQWLGDEIRVLNEDARVEKIEVTPCSFSRRLMVIDSDIDNLLIWCNGVDRDNLQSLNDEFLKQFDIPGLRLYDKYENPPLILPVESNEACIRDYNLDNIPLVTVYEGGCFKSPEEIAEKSNALTSMAFEKNMARIKLFMYTGEIERNFVMALLKPEDAESYLCKDLMQTIDQDDLYLSENAQMLVMEIGKLYKGSIRTYHVQSGEESRCQEALLELDTKGLIWTLDSELLPRWITYGIRWSDSYFFRRISFCSEKSSDLVKSLPGNLCNFPKIPKQDLLKSISQENPTIAETAIRQACDNDSLDIGELIDAYIERLGSLSIFVRASLVECMKKIFCRDIFHVDLCEEKLRKTLIHILDSKDIWQTYSLTGDRQKVARNYLLIHLLTAVAKEYYSRKQSDKGNNVVKFFTDNVLSRQDLSSKIIQDSLKYMGEIFFNISEQNLKSCVLSRIEQEVNSNEKRAKDIARDRLEEIRKNEETAR